MCVGMCWERRGTVDEDLLVRLNSALQSDGKRVEKDNSVCMQARRGRARSAKRERGEVSRFKYTEEKEKKEKWQQKEKRRQ